MLVPKARSIVEVDDVDAETSSPPAAKLDRGRSASSMLLSPLPSAEDRIRKVLSLLLLFLFLFFFSWLSQRRRLPMELEEEGEEEEEEEGRRDRERAREQETQLTSIRVRRRSELLEGGGEMPSREEFSPCSIDVVEERGGAQAQTRWRLGVARGRVHMQKLQKRATHHY